MNSRRIDIAFAIGGETGDEISSLSSTILRLLARRGLHLHTYTACQTLVRGGHLFFTTRFSDQKLHSHGDKLDLLVCLNQETIDRHLGLIGSGGSVVYDGDHVSPGCIPDGVQMCSLPLTSLVGGRNKLHNSVALLGAAVYLLGLECRDVELSLMEQFIQSGQTKVNEIIDIARAGYEHASVNCEPLLPHAPCGPKPLGVWTGNEAMAFGAATSGVKFYAAYPMTPSTGILHWMARNGPELGIMVRQMEDELAVSNMVVGAAHTGCRAMCATSGGGFALMAEAIGSAAMMEIPAVFVDVQRAGPSSGLPTKTEQGDLWQTLGAGQGDYERFIVAPKDALDAFNTIPELFNLIDMCQCPGIVISDMLISENRFSFDPDEIDAHPPIERGIMRTDHASDNRDYKRFEITDDGISPRAIPGLEGFVHVVSTEEQDEDSRLISDVFSSAGKRRAMVEKRARKFTTVSESVAPPNIEGHEDADVTLIGWGTTYGVIKDAVAILEQEGIRANHLPIKWIVPFHSEEVTDILSHAKHTIVVENNYSGQFYRYIRSETGITADGCIRKYDGEPFMPHHIVDGVMEQLASRTNLYVPSHEVMV